MAHLFPLPGPAVVPVGAAGPEPVEYLPGAARAAVVVPMNMLAGPYGI